MSFKKVCVWSTEVKNNKKHSFKTLFFIVADYSYVTLTSYSSKATHRNLISGMSLIIMHIIFIIIRGNVWVRALTSDSWGLTKGINNLDDLRRLLDSFKSIDLSYQ